MYPNNNYNYYQQQPQQQMMPQMYGGMQQQSLLKGRPVSSIEEVKAANIDFDGSVFLFPDIANKRIYTKQINLDGTCTLLMYELKSIPTEPKTDKYITREEFERVIKELQQAKTTVATTKIDL